MIKPCQSCGGRPHTQDELHGKGNRVFNEHSRKDGNASLIVRKCTVCGREETVLKSDNNPKE